MVHRPHRLAEIITVMRQYKLGAQADEICPSLCRISTNMVLIEAVRGGGSLA